MREIKFRGKRGDNGEWVYGDLTRYSEEMSYITVDLIENEVYQVSTETVGQYIGLKDKNGVEIYEGDILLHSFHSNYIQESLSSKQVVQWHEDCCGFGLVLKILAKSKKIEVIGNIYDNLELMEEVE